MWRAGGSRLRPKKGAIERLRADPAPQSAIDIDEMGPVAAKSYPGQQAVNVTARPAQRARQEIDYGQRGKGYGYGALWETTGQCWTQGYERRLKEYFIDFLSFVDAQVPADVEQISAILDNLDIHHADGLLPFMLAHPRWESVYQPKYAAYLNLMEPW